jgi:hypothetical protein
MDFAEVHRLCVQEIHSHARVLAAGFLMKDCGGNVEILAALFQGLAICHLLELLDTKEFRRNLLRSGHVRRYYLRMSLDQGNIDSKYLAISRGEAFLDVLAAGDLQVARDIASLSRNHWNRSWEYEEDFCFRLLLHQLVLQTEPAALHDSVARLERIYEGEPPARLAIARTLISRDAVGFEDALQALLEEERERIDHERVRVVDSKFLFWPRSFLCVEALALLRLAELAGMPVRQEFPLCPKEALVPLAPVGSRDLFAELGTILSETGN